MAKGIHKSKIPDRQRKVEKKGQQKFGIWKCMTGERGILGLLGKSTKALTL